MEFRTTVEGTVVTVKASGKLDTVGATEFAQNTDGIAKDATEIVLDFSDVSYVSSAGLRAVLKLRMANKGKPMSIVNAKGMTAEVFRTAGFGDLLKDDGEVD